MTPAQLSALASAINGDPTLSTLAQANGFPQIADAMNLPSSPAVPVWIPSLSTSRLLSGILAADMPTTAGLIGWLQMMLSVGTVDTTSTNVRAGFSSCFAGKTTLANLSALAQQTATRFEALFVAASVSSAFGLRVSADDVQQALGK